MVAPSIYIALSLKNPRDPQKENFGKRKKERKEQI